MRDGQDNHFDQNEGRSRQNPENFSPSLGPYKVSESTQGMECWLSESNDGWRVCPRCHGPLATRQEIYVVETRDGNIPRDLLLVGGSDIGEFCGKCSVVVINQVRMGQLLHYQKPEWQVGNEYRIVGLVEKDFFPESDDPFGENNPIPLVPFTRTVVAESDSPPKRTAQEKKRKAKTRHRKARSR